MLSSLAETKPLTRIVTLARSQPKERKRFIKFLMVGAVGFAVDLGSFNLMHALFIGPWVALNLLPAGLPQIGAYFTGHPEVIEQSFSFCLAVLSNFLWNYMWIYPEAREANQAKKLTKFAIVSVAGLLIGAPVFSIALGIWRGLIGATALAALQFNVAGNLALMTRVGALLFWNFFVNRYWTYRDVGRH
jgi:putative flippase GtrA